ncbi:integrase core domain-containing protein [Sphingomonas xinjiangensis]|uniref:integrase core domain-containing protein n=1 Tax=Sphingomonas xinjiangensis TaxID=643568 RepID=UPI0016081197
MGERYNKRFKSPCQNCSRARSYILQASVMIKTWRRADTTLRPHSSLSYHPPAPEAGTLPTKKLRR